MNRQRLTGFLLSIVTLVLFQPAARATDPPPPSITSLIVSNSQKTLTWTPYPSSQQYKILTTTNLLNPLFEDTSGSINGYTWISTNNAPSRFHRVQVTPMSSNAVLTAIVLNRLAYGPAPDELARLSSIGGQAYIDEQLAPWNLAEDVSSQNANIPPIDAKFKAPTNIVTSDATSCNLSEFRAWHCLRALAFQTTTFECAIERI